MGKSLIKYGDKAKFIELMGEPTPEQLKRIQVVQEKRRNEGFAEIVCRVHTH